MRKRFLRLGNFASILRKRLQMLRGTEIKTTGCH